MKEPTEVCKRCRKPIKQMWLHVSADGLQCDFYTEPAEPPDWFKCKGAEADLAAAREQIKSQAEMLRTLGEKYSQLEMRNAALTEKLSQRP
jgi:hypothetical protein